MRTIVAVVTGDINASSRINPEQARRLERILESSFSDVVAALPNAGLSGFTGFRGDSWQFVVGCPDLAVRATLLYRSRLLIHTKEEFDRRLQSATAIGFGSIDYMPDDVSAAGGGQAYELSGRRLDRLRRRIPGMGVAGAGDLDPMLNALLGVIDALARRWTGLQARAIDLALQGYTQGEIATRWEPEVSQQAIHKHLAAAGWPALEPALAWIETTLRGCFVENNP